MFFILYLYHSILAQGTQQELTKQHIKMAQEPSATQKAEQLLNLHMLPLKGKPLEHTRPLAFGKIALTVLTPGND